MPRLWLTVLAALLTAVSGYDRLVAFGDSLTDNGGGSVFFMQALNTTQVYPPPPYYDGVFSNGLPYISRTAQLLGLPLEDYAIGGATTGAVPGVIAARPGVPEPIPIPSVVEQVLGYADPNGPGEPVSPTTLFLVYAGANDYYNALQAPNPQIGPALVEAVLGNLSLAVEILVDNGATSFVLPNLPPLQSTPATSQAALGNLASLAQVALTQLVAGHNAGLVVLASELSTKGLKVAILDANEIFESILLNGAQAYNITQVTQPCFNQTTGSVCSNPENHLFWDSLHPTEAVHDLVGELLANEIAV